MKPTNKPANTTPTPYPKQALSNLLSHSDDEFYGSLQRVWNRISAVLPPNEGVRAHSLPNLPDHTTIWRTVNRHDRFRGH